MTDTPKMRSLKGGADDLPPERRDLVKALRALLDLALAGEVHSVTGIVELHDPEEDGATYFEPLFAGVLGNVDGAFRKMDNMKHLIDDMDGTSWLYEDEGEGDDASPE